MSYTIKELFNRTSAGRLRAEGLALALVDWFVREGGLDDLSAVLDGIGPSEIGEMGLSDSNLGAGIVKSHDYVSDLHARIEASPEMARLKVLASEADKLGFDKVLRHRIEAAVAHRAEIWVALNQRQIDAARRALKIVKKVQES
jgi:hypothetical protein